MELIRWANEKGYTLILNGDEAKQLFEKLRYRQNLAGGGRGWVEIEIEEEVGNE